MLFSVSTEILLGINCAFLYGTLRRNVYTELSRQHPRCRAGQTKGKLKCAMNGSRDVPHIRAEIVCGNLLGLGPGLALCQRASSTCLIASMLTVLCFGSSSGLQWWFEALQKKLEPNTNSLEPGHGAEVGCLNRVHRRGAHRNAVRTM